MDFELKFSKLDYYTFIFNLEQPLKLAILFPHISVSTGVLDRVSPVVLNRPCLFTLMMEPSLEVGSIRQG